MLDVGDRYPCTISTCPASFGPIGSSAACGVRHLEGFVPACEQNEKPQFRFSAQGSRCTTCKFSFPTCHLRRPACPRSSQPRNRPYQREACKSVGVCPSKQPQFQTPDDRLILTFAVSDPPKTLNLTWFCHVRFCACHSLYAPDSANHHLNQILKMM